MVKEDFPTPICYLYKYLPAFPTTMTLYDRSVHLLSVSITSHVQSIFSLLIIEILKKIINLLSNIL